MTPPSNHRVVVVGTGIMGCGIAAGMLANGARVVLLGRTAQRAAGVRAAVLETARSVAGSGPGVAAPGLQCAGVDDWNDWDGVSLVVESVAEDLADKQALFARLDRRVPRSVPIGSNSSGHPISSIAGGLAGAARMFGTHYFMPAHVVPLVEVVLGEASDAALGTRLCALFAALGKKPVLVRKDVPGFIANRIQHALMREALSLIDSGIASPEDVDLAVRYSFGFRYAAAGPILQKEISGWDTQCSAAAAIYPSLSNAQQVPAGLAAMVARGDIGMKSGRGFFPWSAEDIAKTRRRYEQHLRAAIEILKDDDRPPA